jgi:hypothetical protein
MVSEDRAPRIAGAPSVISKGGLNVAATLADPVGDTGLASWLNTS